MAKACANAINVDIECGVGEFSEKTSLTSAMHDDYR